VSQPKHGGNLDWAAQIAGCPAFSILDFSASINPLGPPQSAIAAIQRALTSLAHYPDPSYTRLRTALAQWHGISPDWILPGNGAAELLTWAGRELAQQGEVILPVPAFHDYERALFAFGAKVLPLAWDWRKGNLSQVLAKANLDQAKSQGYIVNNPHNPTGKLFELGEIIPLLSQGKLLVLDEAFMDFLPPEQQQSALGIIDQYPNLIIVRSLTKFFSLPGLRLGYVITHPERIRRWQAWRDPWSVNTLAVEAGIAALGDHEFAQKTWQWLPPSRQKLWQGLSAISALHPIESSVNFLLVESEVAVDKLQRQLLQQHQILIRDCGNFAQLGDRFFRVAVRTDAENERLIQAIAEVINSNLINL